MKREVGMRKNGPGVLVGASVPTGVGAVGDFLALKLGELILTTLPDDKDKALEVADFCRENGVRLLLGELMRRGVSDERWHCPSLSKGDFDEIVERAGESYFGRYAIGEAGGVLYWPKEYIIGRLAKSYENLPRFDSADKAREAYVEYLRGFIANERDNVGGGRLLNVESSMLFNYHAAAGIDAFCLEMLPGDPFRMFPAIRGNSRAFGKPWGAHIAMGWYGGVQMDDIWMKRWNLSLYHAFMSGAEFVFPETGHYDFRSRKENGKLYGFNHPRMRQARAVLREFWRFTKIHERPEGGPSAPVAVVFGNNEGCPGLWNPYAWGQYDNGVEWESGPAERGWDLLDVFHRAENCFEDTLMGDHGRSFSGNPPLGQFDIVPVECGLEKLRRHKCLIFVGWNNMTGEIYSKLLDYVRGGGHLVMWLSHFNEETRRGAAPRIFNGGDLSELFGVRVVGAEKTDVIGFKYVRESGARSYNLPFCGTRRDPVFLGRLTPAKVSLSEDASVLCGFSTFRETVEELSARPALVENKVGKGRAWLVTAFEHPGDYGMEKFARNFLRVVLAGEQEPLRLVCPDSVRYSVYDGSSGAAKYRMVYMLNTCYDVSQSARLWISGAETGEIRIPANGLRVACVIGGVVVCPESKDFGVQSAAAKKGAVDLELFTLETQTVEVFNLSRNPCRVRINGVAVKASPGGSKSIVCQRRGDSDNSRFYQKNFMQEPELSPGDTELPY